MHARELLVHELSTNLRAIDTKTKIERQRGPRLSLPSDKCWGLRNLPPTNHACFDHRPRISSAGIRQQRIEALSHSLPGSFAAIDLSHAAQVLLKMLSCHDMTLMIVDYEGTTENHHESLVG